jgi:hypothetical protein
MLLLFVLSIIPRIYLHDLVAHHVSVKASAGKTNSIQLNDTGSTCKCDNLYSLPEFSFYNNLYELTPLRLIRPIKITFAETVFSFTPFFNKLRGPPDEI